MTTDNTPEDWDPAPADSAPAKRLYVKPFMRVLDLGESGGKDSANPRRDH
jgi:hypothetical protein